MVDETRLDDLEEIYTKLEGLADDLTTKDLIADILKEAESYKELYEDLYKEKLKEWEQDNRQRDYEFNGGRL